VPLKLDATSDEEAVSAARAAGDVNLFVNNAGIARPGGFLADGAADSLQIAGSSEACVDGDERARESSREITREKKDGVGYIGLAHHTPERRFLGESQ